MVDLLVVGVGWPVRFPQWSTRPQSPLTRCSAALLLHHRTDSPAPALHQWYPSLNQVYPTLEMLGTASNTDSRSVNLLAHYRSSLLAASRAPTNRSLGGYHIRDQATTLIWAASCCHTLVPLLKTTYVVRKTADSLYWYSNRQSQIPPPVSLL